MEIYHWMILIYFSIPYIFMKIVNEVKYIENNHTFVMNKAEMLLSAIPIIISTTTIKRYEVDFYYIAYTIIIIALYLHSAMRYEKVKSIIEEKEIEPKIPEKKEKVSSLDKEVSFDWSPEGGGGGPGYTNVYSGDSSTYPNYHLFYNSQLFNNPQEYSMTNSNYIRNKKLVEIDIIKKIYPTVKIGYDNGGYDVTKAGLVYDLGGGAKLKHTEYLD